MPKAHHFTKNTEDFFFFLLKKRQQIGPVGRKEKAKQITQREQQEWAEEKKRWDE